MTPKLITTYQPTIEKLRCFPYAIGQLVAPSEESVRSESESQFENKEASGIMDKSQGQGPAWMVFLVWILLPLLLFFLIITFTG